MLKEKYEEEIKSKLMNELSYSNPMEVPGIEKVVVNMGISEREDPGIIDGAVENLMTITGQNPVVTRARKSIADFDIRRGVPVGCKVTLRRERAYEFVNKLFNLALPSIRDFRGLSPDSFDGRGNYSLGIDEQLVFPEITFDDVRRVQGMDITIVTSAETDREGYYLLKELGSPFRE
ncbi:50S ribosomal protein L5 [Candidatus Bipolaricaulota bacterium]|nr:50S ribosomal protein L5 [Candidatus Bipolaricaulota bacterium]MBS3813817.1 50S ribosomal protein L5 [Candidatus Bipolaricaulota bacterium]MBS3824936.1 50S ribosomal protein L5 [Candidatus Bipolaricaulota bacterium]